MAYFLIRSGMILMALAGTFIALAFLALSAFALLILAPGFALYMAGLKSAYKEMTADKEQIKTIDITPGSGPTDIAGKGKALLKAAARRVRNFLNKYAD
jgi:hypothetical protein